MTDPRTGLVIIEDHTGRDAPADDVAVFLQGGIQVDGLIVATVSAGGRDLVVVPRDPVDGARRLRLRVVQG